MHKCDTQDCEMYVCETHMYKLVDAYLGEPIFVCPICDDRAANRQDVDRYKSNYDRGLTNPRDPSYEQKPEATARLTPRRQEDPDERSASATSPCHRERTPSPSPRPTSDTHSPKLSPTSPAPIDDPTPTSPADESVVAPPPGLAPPPKSRVTLDYDSEGSVSDEDIKSDVESILESLLKEDPNPEYELPQEEMEEILTMIENRSPTSSVDRKLRSYDFSRMSKTQYLEFCEGLSDEHREKFCDLPDPLRRCFQKEGILHKKYTPHCNQDFMTRMRKVTQCWKTGSNENWRIEVVDNQESCWSMEQC